MGASGAAPIVIEAAGLWKYFGARAAVADVTFSVRPGECFGVLGPNGAGKTTTIKMITCLAAPSSGTLRVLGLPMVPANHRAVKARLGIVQQEESLDPDLSVEQNLTIYASYFGIPARDAARSAKELMEFAEVGERGQDRIRSLSGGMKRRLMLARALINQPTLLVLDEPTTGLDPQARRLVWDRVRSLRREGMTILLTTHYMDEAEQLCDRLIIMDDGRIIAEGRPVDLIAARVGEEVIEVYLTDGQDADAGLPARLADGPWQVERVGRVFYLYIDQGQIAPTTLSVLTGLEFSRRRATLEDVFLRLTGHRLRD
jgi:lipooligosaccharide transport system ATP-binding protein